MRFLRAFFDGLWMLCEVVFAAFLDKQYAPLPPIAPTSLTSLIPAAGGLRPGEFRDGVRSTRRRVAIVGAERRVYRGRTRGGNRGEARGRTRR